MHLRERHVTFFNPESCTDNQNASSTDDALLVNNRRFQFSGYLRQHLLYLITIPILIFCPYLLFIYVFNEASKPSPTWYFLTFYEWTCFVAINAIVFILISLFIRVLQDIAVQLTPRRHFYVVRVLRRSRSQIILSLYFIAALIILDLYTPTQCKETNLDLNNIGLFSSDPVFKSFIEQMNISSPLKITDESDDNNDEGRNSSCVYAFSVTRKILKCALVTLIGVSVIKFLVMMASILYQDQVYRDRILLNRYHVFITQLLFSICRFEGAKSGLLYTPARIYRKRPRSAFYASQDENIETYPEESGDDEINIENISNSIDENDDEDNLYDGEDDRGAHYERNSESQHLNSNGNNNHRNLRPVTTPIVQARGFVRVLRYLFRISDNVSEGSNESFEMAPCLLTERDWVNFATFKRNVGVFGPDFSLMLGKESSSEAGLPISECKRRAKFVYDVITHGKKTYGNLNPTNFISESKHDSSSENLIPSGYMSKDLLLPPVHQGDFYRLFSSKEAVSEIYSIFDLNLDGSVTRAELKQVFVEVHQDYRNLIRSVSSSAEALNALDLVFSVSMFFILLLIYGLIWGANVTSILTLTLSFILALNVIIGDWAKSAFDSLMFLFICHPFDIGDEVTIEGDSKRYVVSRVHVLKTAMRDATGVEVYMPNPSLLRKNITNWKRSNEQWEQVVLYLGSDTTEEQIYAFRARLTEFLRTQGKHLFHGRFEPDFTPLIGDHMDILVLKFRVPCKLTLDTRRRAERHRLLQNYIRSDLEFLGISYHPRGLSSSPLTFSKERSSFLKAFSRAARRDPLLAEDAAGIAVTMQPVQTNSGRSL